LHRNRKIHNATAPQPQQNCKVTTATTLQPHWLELQLHRNRSHFQKLIPQPHRNRTLTASRTMVGNYLFMKEYYILAF
jgi:hypothetical protein